MNKYDLMHKVLNSSLTPTQKNLLTYLILLSDAKGKSFPTTARLAKVAGVKYEKNFKMMQHLEGYVTVQKVGRQNHYVLNTPAVEGVSEATVILKNTVSRQNTPAQEGVSTDNTPAGEGVSNDESETNTPSWEGVNTPAHADNTPSDAENTPSQEGTYSTSNSSRDSSSDNTAADAADLAEDNQGQAEDDPGSLGNLGGGEAAESPSSDSLDVDDSLGSREERRLSIGRSTRGAAATNTPAHADLKGKALKDLDDDECRRLAIELSILTSYNSNRSIYSTPPKALKAAARYNKVELPV